jgi:hypothetical protein
MALWRCPHCGTPQPVAARCWVCRRSSTSCGTCRNFRSSVVAGIGYCGLDRERLPLAGSEIRPCWDGLPLSDIEAAPAPVVVVETVPAPGYFAGFVPVESLPTAHDGEQAIESVVADMPPAARREPIASPEPPPTTLPSGGLLWADLEA